MRSELVASGLPEDRMRVILTASTPLDVPAESRDAIRTRLRLPVERPVVLYLGRLSEVKGPRHLVAAAAEVLRHAPEAFFALVGDGPLELALRAAVRERGLEDSVLFAGFIPHDEVGHWLAAADVFVLPSLSEGLPHALIEAMSFALPVVASAVGGVPELVADGVNGRLVPPADEAALADALLGLIRDPHARLRFGEEARRGAAARRLTWERFADEVEAVYASISSSKTPSARSSQSK
jgi:glycosyltransferase involved in cell wall biosynthesis